MDAQSQISLPGSNGTFTVAAGGPAPFTYQWRFNGKDIAGENSSTLALIGVQPTDAGGYSVLVVNAAGFVTSRTANLVINTPPVLTAHPQRLTANPGANLPFHRPATRSRLLRYQ